MDIRQLETFLTVAKLLNFRAASEALNYSQSTVSDHIRNLENELNVKLKIKNILMSKYTKFLIP